MMQPETSRERYEEIEDFLDGRVVRHREYFKGNTKIVGVYNFHKKVINSLLTKK